jgi:PAS domain S-box-containing protein
VLFRSQQSEARLLKSEAHQHAILSALPDMIIRINREGLYSEFIASPSFPVLGVAADLVGTNLSETLPPDLVQQRMEYIQLTLQTNSIQIYEQTLCINGKDQIEEVRIVPYSEDEVLLLVRDISEQHFAQRDRQQAEMALAASEAKSRAILSMIPELMFRVGRDLVYREFITQPKDFAMALQNVNSTGRSMLEILPADIAERHISYLQKALQTGELQFYEHKIQDGDRFYDEEVRVIKINEDEVLFMIRDISDRKRAEASLARELSRSKMLFNTSLDGLFVLDLQGKVIEVNQSFADMLGYQIDEIMRLSIYDIDARWT